MRKCLRGCPIGHRILETAGQVLGERIHNDILRFAASDDWGTPGAVQAWLLGTLGEGHKRGHVKVTLSLIFLARLGFQQDAPRLH